METYFKKTINKLIKFFEIIAVLIFIVFELSIWAVAKSVFKYIKALPIFEKVNKFLEPLSEQVIVIIFTAIFATSKLLSLAALALFASGHFYWGIIIYALTFPIGATSIWLLEMQKDKLMTFTIFRVVYNIITKLLSKLKESSSYKSVQDMTAKFRLKFKNWKIKLLDIKNNRKEYKIKILKRYKVLKRYLRIKYGVKDESSK